MGDQKLRLHAALNLVTQAMNSPNAFENSKESTFSTLRRGCLDLRKNVDLLDSDEFSCEQIRDAWLFLIELSKAKLRRKHALECINIMLLSPRWGSVLRNDSRIQDRIPTLSQDMQIALGYQSSPSISPSLGPSSASIPPTGIVRKPSIVSTRPKVSSSKLKRSVSIKGSPIISSLPQREKSIDETPSPPAELPSLIIEPIVVPSVLKEGASAGNFPEEETNPFKLDLNPFKDFRGLKQSSNPYALKAKGKIWWEDQQNSYSTNSWWSRS